MGPYPVKPASAIRSVEGSCGAPSGRGGIRWGDVPITIDNLFGLRFIFQPRDSHFDEPSL